MCLEMITNRDVHFSRDGVLTRLKSIIERAKNVSPDDWLNGAPNAYDWDKKPIPPEVDFYGMDEEEEISERDAS
jgi:hypothetical protein